MQHSLLDHPGPCGRNCADPALCRSARITTKGGEWESNQPKRWHFSRDRRSVHRPSKPWVVFWPCGLAASRFPLSGSLRNLFRRFPEHRCGHGPLGEASIPPQPLATSNQALQRLIFGNVIYMRYALQNLMFFSNCTKGTAKQDLPWPSGDNGRQSSTTYGRTNG